MKSRMLRTTLAASAFSLALLSAGSAVWASHSFSPLAGSRNCSGPHCTFVARWGWPPRVWRLFLDATLSMDTLFVESGITPAGPGSTKIPIDATGQMSGKVSAYHPAQSKPAAAPDPAPVPVVLFAQDGRVIGKTDGLTLCYSFGGSKGDQCEPGGAIGYPDLVGTWTDAWEAFTDPDGDGTYDQPTTAVACTTEPDGPSGTAGRCTTQAGFTALVRIELRRTVEDPMEWDWHNADGTTPPPGSTFYGTSPFPGTMIATTAPIRIGAPASPDLALAVDDLAAAPGSPKVGEHVTFTGKVRNAGQQDAPLTKTSLRLDVDANGSWDLEPPQLLLEDTGPLLPNGAETETWTGVWTATAGTHRFEVCADVGNKVIEADEGNNCGVRTFTVTEPLACDPPAQDVSPNQTAILTAGGGSSGPYAWSAPGGTPPSGPDTTSFQTSYATTGTKTVTVTRGSESSSCTVEVVPLPALTCTPSTQRVRVGAPASFAVSPSAGTYTWTATSGSPETGGPDSTFTTRYQAPGTYTVTVETVSSGQSDSCAVEVTAAGPTFPRGPVREAPP